MKGRNFILFLMIALSLSIAVIGILFWLHSSVPNILLTEEPMKTPSSPMTMKVIKTMTYIVPRPSTSTMTRTNRRITTAATRKVDSRTIPKAESRRSSTVETRASGSWESNSTPRHSPNLQPRKQKHNNHGRVHNGDRPNIDTIPKSRRKPESSSEMPISRPQTEHRPKNTSHTATRYGLVGRGQDRDNGTPRRRVQVEYETHSSNELPLTRHEVGRVTETSSYLPPARSQTEQYPHDVDSLGIAKVPGRDERYSYRQPLSIPSTTESGPYDHDPKAMHQTANRPYQDHKPRAPLQAGYRPYHDLTPTDPLQEEYGPYSDLRPTAPLQKRFRPFQDITPRVTLEASVGQYEHLTPLDPRQKEYGPYPDLKSTEPLQTGFGPFQDLTPRVTLGADVGPNEDLTPRAPLQAAHRSHIYDPTSNSKLNNTIGYLTVNDTMNRIDTPSTQFRSSSDRAYELSAREDEERTKQAEQGDGEEMSRTPSTLSPKQDDIPTENIEDEIETSTRNIEFERRYVSDEQSDNKQLENNEAKYLDDRDAEKNESDLEETTVQPGKIHTGLTDEAKPMTKLEYPTSETTVGTISEILPEKEPDTSSRERSRIYTSSVGLVIKLKEN